VVIIYTICFNTKRVWILSGCLWSLYWNLNTHEGFCLQHSVLWPSSGKYHHHKKLVWWVLSGSSNLLIVQSVWPVHLVWLVRFVQLVQFINLSNWNSSSNWYNSSDWHGLSNKYDFSEWYNSPNWYGLPNWYGPSGSVHWPCLILLTMVALSKCETWNIWKLLCCSK
jgi:hypothetical protein